MRLPVLRVTTETSDDVVLAAVYYETARTEIIARIVQRDQALGLYLAAAAAIAGAAASDLQTRWPVLLLLPFLSAGASFVLAQHNDVIGAIGRFLSHEFDPWVKRNVTENAPPQWDASATLLALKKRPFASRLRAQLLLMPGTALAGLAVGIGGGADAGASVPVLAAALTLGLMATGLAATTIQRSYSSRVTARGLATSLRREAASPPTVDAPAPPSTGGPPARTESSEPAAPEAHRRTG